jgi:hypothetical protein
VIKHLSIMCGTRHKVQGSIPSTKKLNSKKFLKDQLLNQLSNII